MPTDESKPPKKQSDESPLAFLNRIRDDDETPLQLKIDAAKAALPYTAKKASDEVPTTHRHYHLKDASLEALTDEELATFISLVRKATQSGADGEGTQSPEVQHD